MLTFTRHNVHRVIKYTADSELMPSGCQSNKVVMVHQMAAVDIFSVQRFIVFFQEIFQMLFTFESFVLFCISVCILDLLTRSMICLIVCRRMMPEFFWSVPASLGSLSVEDILFH